MRVLWPIYRLESEHNQQPGVMVMSALLKAHGFGSEVVPADLEHLDRRIGSDPDVVVAYSTTSVHSEYLIGLNRLLRQRHPSLFSVFGGPHPTYFPEMVERDGVDAVCIGEGDYPMLELVSARAAGRPVRELKNWWVKEDGVIHKNGIRPLVEDLDALPLPDHETFRSEMPGTVHQALVITTRGCPHCCSYCYNHVYRRLYAGKGRAVRRRSVDHVMEELRIVKAAGYRFVRFMDDLFVVSPAWVEEFAGRYREEIGLPFSCLARADYITPEIVRHLRSAGCHRVLIGVEAGSDRLRNEVLKRRMSREEIVAAARMIRESGIRLVTASMLAIPSGSFEEDWETLELNQACRPSYSTVSILQAYVGTEIHEFAETLGLIDETYAVEVGSAFGFGFATSLRWKSARDKRRIENLQKLFPFAVRFPIANPVVRKLIELPPNRLFRLFYLASVYVGMYFVSVAPRVGLAMLLKELRHRLSRSMPSYKIAGGETGRRRDASTDP